MPTVRSTLRLASLLSALAFVAWAVPSIRFAAGSGRHAEGLSVTYRIGGPLPGAVSATVTSNLGSAPFSYSISAPWIQVTASASVTPASISIRIDPSGLAPGTYTGTVTVMTSVLKDGKIVDWWDTSTITLTVLPQQPSAASVQPASLAFNGGAGQPVPPATLQLSTASSSLPFTITADQPWLAVSPASGVTGTAGAAIVVSVNTAGLAAGSFSGHLVIGLPGGTPSSLTVPVSLTLVSAGTGITPPSITLSGTARKGAAPVLLGSFHPAGDSATAVGFGVVLPPSAPWLSAAPLSGTTPATVQVYANPASLDPGVYNTSIQVNLANATPATYSLPVSFTVTAPPPASFAVSLSRFVLNVTTAHPVSVAPVPVTVSAMEDGQAVPAPFSVAADQPWLKVVPSSGTTPATVTIGADATASPLAAGTYKGTVSISSGGSVQAAIDVTLNVAGTPLVLFSSRQVSLAALAGSESSTSGPVALNVLTQSPDLVDFRISSSQPWLTIVGATLDRISSFSPKTFAVNVDARALSAGTSVATLSLETLDAQGRVTGTDTATVIATISAPAPAIALDRSLLKLYAVAGAAPSTLASLSLTTAAGATPFTVTSSAAWLSVTPSSGTGSQTLAVRVDPSQLGPGGYSATITAAGASAQAAANVQLTVSPPGALPFSATPASVSLTAFSNEPQPVSQVVTLTGLDRSALGNSVYKWTIAIQTEHGGNWLAAELDTAAFPYTVTIFATPTAQTLGTHTGTISVFQDNGSVIKRDIPVDFTILAPVANSYALSAQTVSHRALTGDLSPYRQGIAVVPKLPGLTFSTQVKMDNGAGWLSVANLSGTSLPAAMDIVLDPGSLPAGIYTGTVTCTATGGAGVVVERPSQSIAVRLVVKDPAPPAIAVRSAVQRTFQFVSGSSAVAPGLAPLVTLEYPAPGFAAATVTSSTPWLRFDAASYHVTSQGVTVFASVDPGLAPSVAGVYPADYTVTGPDGKIAAGSVTLLVTAASPSIALTPSASTVTLAAGPFNTTGAAFTLENTGTTTIDFGVSADSSGWLGIANGVNGGTLAPRESVRIVPALVGSFGSGIHFGSITIIATNGIANIMAVHQVALDVQATDFAEVTVGQPDPRAGAADGSPLAYQIRITNPTTQALPFVISSSALAATAGTLPALAISPDHGIIPANGNQQITITANAPSTGGLFGNAIMLYVGGVGFERNVIYSAQAPSGGGCTVAGLASRIMQPAGRSTLLASLPVVITAVVSADCGVPLANGTVTARFSNGDAAIALRSPRGDGIWQGTWVPASTVSPEVIITVTARDGAGVVSGTAKQTVFVGVNAGVPVINPGGVLNAADLSTPNIAQTGSYVTIFGQNLAPGEFASASDVNLPASLGDTQVLLAGDPIGLKSVLPQAITAYVPSGLPVNFSLPLQVVRGNLQSNPQNLYITDKNPAFFLASNTETRPGLFVAARGGSSFQVDPGHPAKAGDVLTAMTTGLGWTGAAGNVSGSVVLTIGGVTVIPDSAALAPGIIGVYQVTATLPAGIPAGNQVPVTISVDGRAGKAVTIAVQ